MRPLFIVQRRYENFFDHEQVSWLTKVYKLLYPNESIHHVPMFHEKCYEINVFGERLLSKSSKGNQSAVVCAYWPGTGGTVSPSCDTLRVGVVQHFIKHTIEIEVSSQEKRKVSHMFAFVYWYKVHPRANWFHPRIIVISPDMIMNGPAVFLPISRIFALVQSFQMMFILIMVLIMCLLQLSSHTSFVTNNYEKLKPEQVQAIFFAWTPYNERFSIRLYSCMCGNSVKLRYKNTDWYTDTVNPLYRILMLYRGVYA